MLPGLFPSRRRASVEVLAAALMTVMAGMIAFGIDCGVITLAREQLQNAADSASIAGADALASSPGAAQAAAQNFAQANIAGGMPVVIDASQDIEIGVWDATASTFTLPTGASSTRPNAVRVTCRMSQARGTALKLFFAPIFGVNSADVSAQAIALLSSNLCGPFIGLNSVTISGGTYTDSYNSNLGAYSGSGAGQSGTVCSNGAISLSGSGVVVNGDAHPGVGDTVSASDGAVTGSMAALTQALNEPAVDSGNAATANNNADIPQSAFGAAPLDDSGNFSLNAGDSVSLPPGTYYFTSLTLAEGSTITLTGQTIIYCQGSVSMSDGSVLNGNQLPADCQIYAEGATVSLPGSSPFYGIVYAPTANIIRNGSADFFGMLIGASLNLSGGGGLHADLAVGPLMATPQPAQIVQ